MSPEARSSGAMFEPVGRIESPHPDLDAAPAQSSESAATARVVIDARFADAMLGLDRYPHLWLITWLDRQPDERPLRVVPRATQETGEVQGVFASRYPFRPNGIGLSLVRNLGVDGTVITVAGVDLLDGTPVLDVKPWFADCDDPRQVGA